MLKIQILSSVLTIALGVFAIPSQAQTSTAVYDNIGHLTGNVSITNHPQLGKTPANFFYIVFRRVGCRKCLIGTRTDIDGKYELFLGEGRYEILVFNPSPPVYDLLDPDQTRTVKVSSGITETRFDIVLRLQNK